MAFKPIIDVVIFCVFLMCATNASAVTINLEQVSSFGGGHRGLSMDPVTGKFYVKDGYFSSGSITVYNNAADFEAGSPAGSVALSPTVFAGTYFEVNNGKIYGRADSVWPGDSTGLGETSIAKWDAGTGIRELVVASLPGMGGLNGTHTFNWGGFSGVNWMQDQTGTYVFGRKQDSSGWMLNKMDENLNVIQTQSIVKTGSFGYAFMINGYLFASDVYTSNSINTLFNSDTGDQSVVDFVLSGGGSAQYWGNTFYDSISDTLYLNNVNNGLYKVTNASVQFGVSTIPVPAAAWLFGSGLIGLIGLARRKVHS